MTKHTLSSQFSFGRAAAMGARMHTTKHRTANVARRGVLLSELILVHVWCQSRLSQERVSRLDRVPQVALEYGKNRSGC